jgi:Mg-chelatase subunit ChlD
METNEKAMKTKVYNLVILDKSGSMESIRKEAVDGYNETLGTIRAAQIKHMDTQEHFVSLAAFCGCGIEMIYDKTPIQEADKLRPEQYEPCCMTPLYDAIGKTIKKLKKDIQDDADAAVLVTIITDGCENDSKEWTGAAIKKLVEECKEEGWMFAFIGAGEEVVKEATTISITNTIVWEKSSAGTEAMFCETNDASTRFFDKMAMCDACASVDERRQMRKKFSEEYY